MQIDNTFFIRKLNIFTLFLPQVISKLNLTLIQFLYQRDYVIIWFGKKA